jgi:hypothetical protein
MSLINEALKKAQRARASDHGSVGVPPQSGLAGAYRPKGKGLPLSWVLLGVSGAAVLVCLTIFGTVYLLRKPVSSINIKSEERALNSPDNTPTLASSAANSAPSSPSPATQAAAQSSQPLPSSTASAPSPASGEALIRLGRSEAAPDAKHAGPALALNTQASLPVAASSAAQRAPSLSTVLPPPQTAPKPSKEIQAFVDNVKVMGIRSAGKESKVLMNDRVFRVNDMVDRSLGLKLTEVATDHLVFVDENGFTYTRNF